jgi:PBSX family phage portal protein
LQKQRVRAKVISVAKAVNTTQDVKSQVDEGYNEIIEYKYNPKYLLDICENSTILGQCIEAYKRNIAGFGASLKYRQSDVDETDEMKREWTFVEEDLLPFFSFDKSFKEIWEQAIEHREGTGNGYIEIIRDGTNKPVEAANMQPQYMKTTKLSEPVKVTYNIRGKTFTRMKRFRRYVQEINGTKIWFKQFGDPRFLNSKTGKFTDTDNGPNEATEVLHLKIGDGAYGVPRWVPHVIHIMGARKAEELNYRYFKQGRHVPMAILLKNGLLTEDSEQALTEYVSSVEGEEGQHKFLILEVEGSEDDMSIDDKSPNVDIELKTLAEILQKDALFLEYDDKSRQKVQSAFRLPDIYVGYSRDFNRATADTARQVTEEQVFEPERESLEFIINNILLLDHQLKHVLVVLNKPEINDTQDKASMLSVLGTLGGIAPDDVRDEAAKVLGKTLESFGIDEAKIPLQLQKQSQMTPIMMQKAKEQNVDLINVLKDLRDIIEERGV